MGPHGGSVPGQAFRRLWIVLLLALAAVTPAAGQEAGAPAEEDVEAATETAPAASGEEPEESELDRARRKLELLGATRDRAEDLVDRSRAAEGEERELLRIEGLKVVEDLRDLVADLVTMIPDLDAPPEAVDEIRLTTGRHLEYVGEVVLTGVRRSSRRISDLRRLRETVEVGRLAELEEQINDERDARDRTQEVGLEVVARLQAIDFDASELEESLEEWILERAESMGARLQLAVTARDRIEAQVEAAKRAGAQDELAGHRTRAEAAELRIRGLVRSLRQVLDELDERGVETAELRRIVIQATGEITEDILDTGVLVGLMADFFRGVGAWIRDRGPTMLFQIVVVILFIVLFRWGSLVVWLGVRIVTRPTKLLAGLVGRMIRPTASFIGLIAGLWFLGVNPAALLTGVGVAGIIVGFALQDSLANLAAGVFILVYRPYDEGDIVSAGGVLGTVKEMGLANTTIMTFDNRRLFVPNKKVWGEVIENRSSEELRRVDTAVRIKDEEDIDRAIGLIRGILAAEERILDEPTASVFVSKLEDSYVEIAVWPWTPAENWWPLRMDLPRLLRIGLSEAGVAVPYPRAEILLESGAERPGGREDRGGA